MKVQIVKPVSIKINGTYWNLKKDQIHDVPEDSGKTLINRGYAFVIVDSLVIPEIFPEKSTTKTIVVEEPVSASIENVPKERSKSGKKTLKELMKS